MAPSVNQVLRLAAASPGGLTAPSTPPQFLPVGYDRNTQDQDLQVSDGGVAVSAPANTNAPGESLRASTVLMGMLRGEDVTELDEDLEPFTEELKSLMVNTEDYLAYCAEDLILSLIHI